MEYRDNGLSWTHISELSRTAKVNTAIVEATNIQCVLQATSIGVEAKLASLLAKWAGWMLASS